MTLGVALKNSQLLQFFHLRVSMRSAGIVTHSMVGAGGWLVGWLVGCLVGWLVGCLVGWLVGG